MECFDEHIYLAELFGFDPKWVKHQSIYPFCPVFLCHHPQAKFIIKRTRSPIEKADALMEWTMHLKSQSIPVVTPVNFLKKNPVSHENLVWVAYPYVEGDVFQGKDQEISSAGDLLGRIHQSSYHPNEDFCKYLWDRKITGSDVSIVEDLSKLRDVMKENRIEGLDLTVQKYANRFHTIYDEIEILLSHDKVDLPWCCASWDYKANNLIYNNGYPTLIDPDNAGFLPRIFDLALSLILFNNEHSSASARLFTKNEWAIFLKAYLKHVTLTSVEKKNWPSVLEFMRLEEGLWLLIHDIDGWKDPHQGCFLRNLLNADLSLFLLDK